MPILIMFYLSICPFIQPRMEVGNEKTVNDCILFIKLDDFLDNQEGDIG